MMVEMTKLRELRFVLLAFAAALVSPVSVQAQSSLSSLPIQANERAALFPSPNSIEQGKALAEAGCAECHGHNGISTDEHRPHLAGQRTVYLYREMLAYQEGARSNEDMREAVAFLDSDALLKTAIYYASLPPPFDPEAVAAAAGSPMQLDDDPLLATKAATAGCGSCHGATGNSSIPGMPSLTSQHPDYFVASMKAYQSGERTDNMMQMLVAALDVYPRRDHPSLLCCGPRRLASIVPSSVPTRRGSSCSNAGRPAFQRNSASSSVGWRSAAGSRNA